jgi:hypothetical protein
MPYTNYTIIPSDGTVVIDGVAAFGVDMTGIPADVHAIQWYGLRSSGTIEYVVDPITGVLPPQGSFTDPTVYQTYTDEAEQLIYAANNPVTYYVTQNGLVYGDVTYGFGQAIVIDTPSPVQPTGTTADVPPTPQDFQTLYWYNDAWVISSFDPQLALADAQAFLVNVTKTSASEASAYQTRIYSPLQFSSEASPETLPTADYSGVDLGTYQAYLDGEVSATEALINAATTTEDLYGFNPAVDPTYTP